MNNMNNIEDLVKEHNRVLLYFCLKQGVRREQALDIIQETLA